MLLNLRTISRLDTTPGSGVIFAHPCQRQGGVKGSCFGSTRGLRTKARKANRAAKRSAAVSKAPLALQGCSVITNLGFGSLGGGWGSPHLLRFNLLARVVTEKRVTNDLDVLVPILDVLLVIGLFSSVVWLILEGVCLLRDWIVERSTPFRETKQSHLPHWRYCRRNAKYARRPRYVRQCTGRRR